MFVCLFDYSVIYLFVCLFMHLIIHSFLYLFAVLIARSVMQLTLNVCLVVNSKYDHNCLHLQRVSF